MSDRYQGGIITKTPVTPTGPSALGTASGIWTLEQQAYWQAQGLWPDANNLPAGDAYYKYVTMLLPGNGTNGAQNNTFLDSSSNAFTITRNGNTTQGTFSPYGSNWGNARTDTSISSQQNLTTTLPSTLGSGDWTIECWFNCLVNTGVNAYFFSQSGNVNFVAGLEASGGSQYISFYNGIDGWGTKGTTAIQPGVWYHYAVVRSGSTLKGYLNGNLEFSYSISVTFDETNLTLMSRWGLGASPHYYAPLVGTMSNARIVKGTAVYSGSSFTVPTTPLTAVSGTQILTCQSNRFVDNSGNNLTITANGSPSVQRFSPFELPYPGYTAATYGGSGYFDGSGDYLSPPANTAFAFGTNAFTIEGWFYSNSSSASQSIADNYNGEGAGSDGTVGIVALYAGNIRFTSITSVYLSYAYTANQWNHFAIVRSGTTLSLFLNGSRVATTTNSSNFTSTTSYKIGAEYNSSTASNFFSGNLSDIRLVKGTAVYDPSLTTITVPTAPLTAITNTSLLCNFTNTGIIDNAMMNDLETAGNAQISTTQSKFGGSSMYFDGTGDYLVCNNQNRLNSFGRGDFTVEFWLYISSAPATNQFYPLLDSITSDYAELAWTITLDWNLKVRFQQSGSSLFIPTTAISTGTWTHIAIVRSGNTTKEYLNGDLAVGGSGTDTMNYACGASRPVIGTQWDNSRYLNGYLQDVRITKGYARYTGSFTPPTQAFYTY